MNHTCDYFNSKCVWCNRREGERPDLQAELSTYWRELSDLGRAV